MMLARTATAAAALISFAPQADHWQSIGQMADGTTLSIDNRTLKPAEMVQDFWLKLDFSTKVETSAMRERKQRLAGLARNGIVATGNTISMVGSQEAQEPVEAKEHWQARCGDHRFAVLARVAYNEQGNPLSSERFPAAFTSPVPDSVAEAVLSRVCSRPS